MSTPTFHSALWQWIDTHIFDLGRELRLSYLPPLMISRHEHFRTHGDCQHILRQGVFGFVRRVSRLAGFLSRVAIIGGSLAVSLANQIRFTVTREVRDTATSVVTIPADYSELGLLLITATVLSLVLPLLAIGLVRIRHVPSA